MSKVWKVKIVVPVGLVLAIIVAMWLLFLPPFMFSTYFRVVEGDDPLPASLSMNLPSISTPAPTTPITTDTTPPTDETTTAPNIPPQPTTPTDTTEPVTPPPEEVTQEEPVIVHPTSNLVQGDRFHRLSSGTAMYIEQGDMKWLRIEDLDMIDGPRVHVWLTADIDNVTNDYVDLGLRRGTRGNFTYEIPQDTDLSKYRYVVHWCVPFGVLFNSAELSLSS